MLKLAARWRNVEQARQAVSAMLASRYPLRLHSFVLFAWTIFAGNMTGQICGALGMNSLPARYAIVCIAAYAAFLFGVRVWLWHIEAIPDDEAGSDGATEVIDIESVGDAAGWVPNPGSDAIETATDADADVAADGDVSVLALVALALAATLAVLLLGPEMLVDVALEAILAGSLIGAARLGHEPDWFMRVLGKTWWIFLLAAGFMVGFGNYAHQHYPDAASFSDVLRQMVASKK